MSSCTSNNTVRQYKANIYLAANKIKNKKSVAFNSFFTEISLIYLLPLYTQVSVFYNRINYKTIQKHNFKWHVNVFKCTIKIKLHEYHKLASLVSVRIKISVTFCIENDT